MYLQNLDGEEIVENNKYNLNWSKIKNERGSLSIMYAGKKKFFANFLSEDRRLKLKRIIEKYNSISN
jgi:predicted regulator of Ras-like GTPase activity (Roadblock/LC7/MglB family)